MADNTSPDTIENRVAKSPLITLGLDDWYPSAPRRVIDLSPWLYEGLIVREKSFREAVKAHDWTQYQGQAVALQCSTDAIIPQWAYLLVATALQPYAHALTYGSEEELETLLWEESLRQLPVADYQDKPVIVKGCSERPVPASAYVRVAALLRPVVKSLLFGEACSTVPVYKKRKSK
ncbi:MAG: DUF2480 family protein [Schleiferiaceae bacterium]|nr:DUF2480 family protein [Schleiferiaceae bacterium]